MLIAVILIKLNAENEQSHSNNKTLMVISVWRLEERRNILGFPILGMKIKQAVLREFDIGYAEFVLQTRQGRRLNSNHRGLSLVE